jgi:hypothetical protein
MYSFDRTRVLEGGVTVTVVVAVPFNVAVTVTL